MLTRLHISIIIGLAATLWVGLLFVRGSEVTWEHLWPFSAVVGITTAVMAVFERTAWRWWVFRGWLVKEPDIGGTWRAVLQTDWIDPATGDSKGPLDAIVVIRQTYSTLSIRMYTAESQSFLIAGKIDPQNDGVHRVVGVYQNEPDVHLRTLRSPMHHGAFMLTISGEPATKIAGAYWTERNTKGSMVLTDRRDNLVDDFVKGAALFAISPRNTSVSRC